MQQPTPAAEAVKEQVVDTAPKRIKELKFGILYDNVSSLCTFSNRFSVRSRP